MTTEERMSPGDSKSVSADSVVIRVDTADSALRSAGKRLLASVLVASVLMNIVLLISTAASSNQVSDGVNAAHHSGVKGASDRIAVINFEGTIMPPFTERWQKQIRKATEDDSVKAVLLAIDSPGGLVADSHQLYYKLQQLKEKKPIFVAMKRLAASGGYYIAMAIGEEGRIFVEPTTWTGSIGVIIPRYNAAELASRAGVKVEPLATGPMKDSLNPFRDLSEQEQQVWDTILKDSFDRFVGVIEQNRSVLNEDQVRSLATGQIYTANQAIENGLADQIGYEEEALVALAEQAGLSSYEVIEYSSSPTLIDLFLSGKAESSASVMEQLLDASLPKAMYYCSWNPWVPSVAR